MEKLSLEGKVAIVTGSSSGIGRAIAILFVRRGAKVTLNGRTASKLDEVVEECKAVGAKDDQVFVVAGDVTNENVRHDLVEKTVSHFGHLDILVNNAGRLAGEALGDITEAGLDMMMDLLFKAPIFLSKAAFSHLKATKGCIINTSTTVTAENFPGFFSYTVAKHAIDKFTEYAALEFRAAGIRVNSVKPGAMETNIFNDMFNGDNEQVNAFLDDQKKFSMLGRVGQPEEVAEMVAFLASDAASYVTSHHFVVDGAEQNISTTESKSNLFTLGRKRVLFEVEKKSNKNQTSTHYTHNLRIGASCKRFILWSS